MVGGRSLHRVLVQAIVGKEQSTRGIQTKGVLVLLYSATEIMLAFPVAIYSTIMAR